MRTRPPMGCIGRATALIQRRSARRRRGAPPRRRSRRRSCAYCPYRAARAIRPLAAQPCPWLRTVDVSSRWPPLRRKAGNKIIDRLTRHESTTADFHRPELSSGHQLVNAGAADAELLGGELDRTQARRPARDFFGFVHIKPRGVIQHMAGASGTTPNAPARKSDFWFALLRSISARFLKLRAPRLSLGGRH
jgi:hypothetical protein